MFFHFSGSLLVKLSLGFLLVVYLSVSCNKSFSDQGVKNMSDFCDISEDLSEFSNAVARLVGHDIDSSDIDILRNEFEVLKDEEVIDPFYSRTEKLRFITLVHNCTASDGVSYDLYIGALIDSLGDAVFSQNYIIYRSEDIVDGKRGFLFSRLFGGNDEYEKILSEIIVGKMSEDQLHSYMESIGCTIINDNLDGRYSISYLYSIDPKNDLASRLAGWNFSKKILVGFDDKGTVSEISVKEYNPY